MKYKEYSLYETKYNRNIWSQIMFETESILGRIFFNNKPPTQPGKQYLNVGCGKTIINGWVNADFFSLINLINGSANTNWMLDLRYQLNCPSNYWDGVYSEHTIEHLKSIEVIALLKELFRTLKPGCWLRITAPDLEKYVRYYTGRKVHPDFKKYWKNKGEAIWALTSNWGHESVWDYQMLSSLLEKTGFIKISRMSFGTGTDKEIIKDIKDREWETMYVEAQKPLQ